MEELLTEKGLLDCISTEQHLVSKGRRGQTFLIIGNSRDADRIAYVLQPYGFDVAQKPHADNPVFQELFHFRQM